MYLELKVNVMTNKFGILFTCSLIGCILGGIVNYFTRPTILGVRIPYEVITSTNRYDQLYKDELVQSMLLTIGGGVAIGFLIGILLITIKGK